ncbi:phosphatidate cytidylyltransferase, partial [Streptococcus sp. SPC0]|nr:phosphatidate cytidylyltransferase [Streptococcus sp. SPC0]
VLNSNSYSFEDAAFPIASSFYVGIGFQNLVSARMAGIDKVLLALFIVWATDIGAYMIGRQFGQRKLLPSVSPNKTIEGSLGGIASAIVVAFFF